jgi:hypothetical protein
MTKDQIKTEMNKYRMGMRNLPNEYIDIHQMSARIDTSHLLQATGMRKLAEEMISDGWIDGMKVLRLICEDRRGQIHDIRWSDANGGSWFEKLPSGGQVLVLEPLDKPGYL